MSVPNTWSATFPTSAEFWGEPERTRAPSSPIAAPNPVGCVEFRKTRDPQDWPIIIVRAVGCGDPDRVLRFAECDEEEALAVAKVGARKYRVDLHIITPDVFKVLRYPSELN